MEKRVSTPSSEIIKFDIGFGATRVLSDPFWPNMIHTMGTLIQSISKYFYTSPTSSSIFQSSSVTQRWRSEPR